MVTLSVVPTLMSEFTVLLETSTITSTCSSSPQLHTTPETRLRTRLLALRLNHSYLFPPIISTIPPATKRTIRTGTHSNEPTLPAMTALSPTAAPRHPTRPLPLSPSVRLHLAHSYRPARRSPLPSNAETSKSSHKLRRRAAAAASSVACKPRTPPAPSHRLRPLAHPEMPIPPSPSNSAPFSNSHAPLVFNCEARAWANGARLPGRRSKRHVGFVTASKSYSTETTLMAMAISTKSLATFSGCTLDRLDSMNREERFQENRQDGESVTVHRQWSWLGLSVGIWIMPQNLGDVEKDA